MSESFGKGVVVGVAYKKELPREVTIQKDTQDIVTLFFEQNREELGLTLRADPVVCWSSNTESSPNWDVSTPVKVSIDVWGGTHPKVERQPNPLVVALNDALATLEFSLAWMLKERLLAVIQEVSDKRRGVRYTREA